ncbi:SGNH/GDSL hydrolase family protein [Ramlibacter sp. AW1]|uniref:SGNH/GDSL hydrolase family protein n=1 Tax=Ramlibacter aurantiacus TaxID=2801330 RepID=A0A936ZGT2_9BURK|nr:SGNH/GDSL hydrolase family protein [Ramlibacter aurantiacus]MBL0421164.1 SGNH/GDSL hydrolase family protein [Ramlibacter aurantiacus]
MAFQRSRRSLLAASLSAAVLAACGGGDVVSQFTPARIVVFGDGSADLGRTDAADPAQNRPRYTINDGSIGIWTRQLAARYGLPLASSDAGGSSYAIGNARVAAATDAAGNTGTPTIVSQIAAYSPLPSDLVVISAGFSDVIAEARQTQLSQQTREQGLADLDAAARQLGEAVAALVQRGAGRVVVTGPYDLSISPWARATGQGELLRAYSSRFISSLKVSMVRLGGSVLYLDREDYVNRIYNRPDSYGITNVAGRVCTSVDPGPGIGIGENQVSSALCTPATLEPSADPARWLFADAVYLTPAANRLFGDFAYDTIRRYW